MINALPYAKRGINSNYGEELEEILRQNIQQFFAAIAERRNLYQQCSAAEVKIILRYHSLAIFAFLQEWKEQDTAQLDQIVHTIYRLLTEGIPPMIEK